MILILIIVEISNLVVLNIFTSMQQIPMQNY